MDVKTEKLLQKYIKEGELGEFKTLLQNTNRNVNRTVKGCEPLLHMAIVECKLEFVKCLLDQGASTDLTNESGHRAIHIASKTGNLPILDLIVKQDGNACSDTELGDTPLYLAVANQEAESVEYLIQAGADVNAPASFVYSRSTALHKASTLEDSLIMDLLLATSANINAQNDSMQTPLFMAAAAGRAKNVKRLIQCGAKTEISDTQGTTPLIEACHQGHADVVRELCIAGAAINTLDKGGIGPLYKAVINNHLNVLKILLHFGADPNKPFTSTNRTAMHYAANSCSHGMSAKWTPKYRVTVNQEIEVLDTLLQYNVDINVLDYTGTTPLHLCVVEGCAAVLEYLLKSGADYLTYNKYGMTPLHEACKNNITDAIKLLVRLCPGLVQNNGQNNDHQSEDEDSETDDLTVGFIRAASSTKKSPLIYLAERKNLSCLKLLMLAGYVANEAEKFYIVDDFSHKISKMARKLVSEEYGNPRTLARLSKYVIRNTLYNKLQSKVMKIPVPQKVREMILLEDELLICD